MGEKVGVLNKKNLARRGKRMGMCPQDPKDMDFMLDQEALPDGFWRVEVEGRRHLIFSTDAQVKVIGRAVHFYVDRTFKCMRFPFVILLTTGIHAFVRRADYTKQVLLVFAVMSGRKTQDYAAVFESVRRFVIADEVGGMVIDYEKALWKAARYVFPNINMSGCAFHWGEAVCGHVKSL